MCMLIAIVIAGTDNEDVLYAIVLFVSITGCINSTSIEYAVLGVVSMISKIVLI